MEHTRAPLELLRKFKRTSRKLQKMDDREPSPAPRRKRQFVEPTALAGLKCIG
jgi:hypothetical protein